LTEVVDPFRDYQLATAAAYLCATAGLTVLVGRSGQLSLGHGALMAVGAYTVALVQNRLAAGSIAAQWTFPVSLLAGVAAATLAGLVIGVAAARLRGPYLAGLTLVVAVAAPAVTTVWYSVFNGDQGLSVALPPAPNGLGADFPFERWQAWQAGLAALVVMFLLANLIHSRFGRTMQAVRDDEVAARLSGIHLARTQVLAFVVSAACAGLAGGTLAMLVQNVTPGGFALTLSLNLVLAAVIGGLGSLAGAVWGSLLLVFLPQLTDSFTSGLHVPAGVATRLAGNLPLAVFGLLLAIVMIVAPGGIQGLVDRANHVIRRAWHDRRRAGPATSTVDSTATDSPSNDSPPNTAAASSWLPAGAPDGPGRFPPERT
jgi:branched-chain amino acid transport system permease protein